MAAPGRWAGARGRQGIPVTSRRGDCEVHAPDAEATLPRPAPAAGMPGTGDAALRANTGSPERMGGHRRKYAEVAVGRGQEPLS